MSEELKAALARIACLEGEIAKRDETIARLVPPLNRAVQANYDLREELAACRIAVENCELFRARIAELEQDLAYFPSTVRSLAETVTEREAEINQLRAELAELAAIKAKSVMPDVNLAAKALCSRHAAICGVDEDGQWKEYGQDFIADAETVLANSRLCAATVLEVNAHCAVIPEPYGWVAAGSFYTDRESAICAAEKTPCIDVYSRPQMNALENRSLQRQELAEELARQLNASCAEIRNMRNLYAAPVSEAKAQGVVMPERWNVPRPMWKDARQPYGNPLNHADIEAAEKFNLALDEVVRLNAAQAAPAADASDVLDQAMYTLISIGYHENSGLVHELRQALAAHRSTGVV